MPLRRADLRNKFSHKQSAVPNDTMYRDLINSMLNLWDDKFFGVWRNDAAYCKGGVVFYNKDHKFYILEGWISETEPYCNATPPPNDGNWAKISDGADEDWFINDTCMYANEKVKTVGIGTTNPVATLDVKSAGKGQIKLEPNQVDPSLTIINLDPGCDKNYLTEKVTTEYVDFETDSKKGFHFSKISKTVVANKTDNVPSTPLVITTDATGKEPRVGIGTLDPKAHFEVKKDKKGIVSIDSGERGNPSVKIKNLDDKCDPNYLKLTLGTTEAAFVTDAKGGFQFKKSVTERGITTEEPQLTIAENDNIGIQTTTPNAALHIASKNDGDGTVKAGFCKTYPIVQLVNLRDNGRSSFAVMGVSNNQTVLVSDTESFVFKNRKSLDDAEGLINITKGEELVQIFNDGKVAIGSQPKDVYELDVSGSIQSHSLYFDTDQKNIIVEDDNFGTVLSDVCDLTPVRFEWKPNGGHVPEGKQLGLVAQDVECYFPEAIRKGNDGIMSVAYANLVPVLVKAIQEQQATIQALKAQMDNLENRLCALESNE